MALLLILSQIVLALLLWNLPDYNAAHKSRFYEWVAIPIKLLILGCHYFYSGFSAEFGELLIVNILDLITVYLLLKLLEQRRINRLAILFYLANPLIILAAADASIYLAVMFSIVLSIYTFNKPKLPKIIALLTLIPLSIFYTPILFFTSLFINRKRYIIFFLLIAAFSLIPYDKSGFSALEFLCVWMPADVHKGLTSFLLIIVLAGTVLLKQGSYINALMTLLMFFYILVPGIHPESMVLLVPFCIFFPKLTNLSLLAVSAVFIYHPELGLLAWLFMAFIYLYDQVKLKSPSHCPAMIKPSMALIIPVFNEGENIAKNIEAIQKSISYLRSSGDSQMIHIYAVDGGSTDNTIEQLKKLGITVIKATQKGRGLQFKAGIEQSSEELILMLHADSIMAEDALVNLFEKLYKNSHIEWGILGHKYDKTSLRMKIIEWSNSGRFHFGAMAFGDQGIFIRRTTLDRIGGMPAIKLMEDVELSLRLAAVNSRMHVGNCLTASTRGWEKHQYSGYIRLVIKLVFSYMFFRQWGLNLDELSEKMYKVYYEK